MSTPNFIAKLGHNKDVRSVVESEELVDTTLVGVELELENMPDDGMFNHWKVVNDGSLKNSGYEFVFSQPFGGKDVEEALSEFNTYIISNGLEPEISERTSVHVHIDVRDLEMDDYINFIGLYLVFEMSLFNYCGVDRASNTFSMPWRKLDQTVFEFAGCKSVSQLHRLINKLEQSKYTSINIGSTKTFGSIEFRGHGGEWRKDKLLVWINLLLSIKKYILSNKINWDNLLSHISHLGSDKFTHDVFGKFSKYLQYPEQSYDVMQGVRLMQDIMYADNIQSCYEYLNYDEDYNTREVTEDNMSSVFSNYLQNKHGDKK